jgi:hypothetical protein
MSCFRFTARTCAMSSRRQLAMKPPSGSKHPDHAHGMNMCAVEMCVRSNYGSSTPSKQAKMGSLGAQALPPELRKVAVSDLYLVGIIQVLQACPASECVILIENRCPHTEPRVAGVVTDAGLNHACRLLERGAFSGSCRHVPHYPCVAVQIEDALGIIRREFPKIQPLWYFGIRPERQQPRPAQTVANSIVSSCVLLA